MKRIILILIIGSFLCQHVAFCIPEEDSILRLPLLCSEMDEEVTDIKKEPVGLVFNEIEPLKKQLMGHQLRNDITPFWSYLEDLGDLLESYPEIMRLYWELRNKWFSSLQAIDSFEKYEESISLTESFLVKVEGLLEGGTLDVEKGNEIVCNIKKVKNSIEVFQSFIEESSFLHTGEVNEIIIFYNRKKRVNCKLELSWEPLKFNKVVDGEEFIIMGIIDNLYRNAKRTSEIESEITIKTSKEDYRWIRIEVSDMGEGISEEILPKIFDEGFTTRESKIGGLGLYLTLKYLKFKRGGIQVDTRTEEGKALRLSFDDGLENSNISLSDRIERGTTFTVWIPLAEDIPELEQRLESVRFLWEVQVCN